MIVFYLFKCLLTWERKIHRSIKHSSYPQFFQLPLNWIFPSKDDGRILVFLTDLAFLVTTNGHLVNTYWLTKWERSTFLSKSYPFSWINPSPFTPVSCDSSIHRTLPSSELVLTDCTYPIADWGAPYSYLTLIIREVINNGYWVNL